MILSFVSLLVQEPIPQSDRNIFIQRYERVRFYYEIDEDSVDRLERILGPGDIIDLGGPGGDLKQSVRMADLVRDRRGRVRAWGHCTSGCSIVWVSARERLTDGFHAVTFHGSPIASLAWMRDHPDWVRPDELDLAVENAALMKRLLDEVGVQPWLFHCAYRLQNLSHELVGGLDIPAEQRVRTTGDYSAVWFPRSILEAAGVRQLERYDPPNERQRLEVEQTFGPYHGRLRTYWAQDADCDVERNAVPVAEAG